MKLNKKQALTMLLNLPKYSNMDIDKKYLTDVDEFVYKTAGISQ